MKDQINKLIRISISKLSLIPLISKLNDDLSNLKLEINKINQIKSNNPENIKNVQSLGEKTKIKIIVQENKEKDQEINQYINQIKQQQDQIQVQLEQINQFKQEQEYLNQQIEKQKLQNQKLKQQIEQYQSQQSNQLQQFQQQQNQYYPQIQNQPTPFQQNIDSSYQKVSFQFIKNYQVNIKNDGKIASAAGGGDVLCEPSIPLNQNVKFAFRVIKIDGQINLGFGLKDQYGQPKNRQLYEQYFQFNKKDTVLLDIRMNEKKLIAQNLRSSQQGQFSIDTDTSQALYLVVFLVHSCIEIVDDY
ncbi:unnamed protein product [Paramecium sonneborni]|uniref:Uncharacterized protein n=1 Tax=Paramecium sonneborni TaxID=65129 RepID=A0A8S1PY81_9CILI|nr:unnamed protein product [Paramecium sonneborni]